MNKLLRAFIERDLNKARELIKQGEDLNKPYNDNGWTPFLWLVKEFYEVEIVEEFIKLGGDVNQCTKENLSPLMIAATHRSSPDIIELLIQYGADVDHQDNYGHTAIMKLIKHPQLGMRKSILQALIDNGCDLTTLRNIQGKSAMDMILEKI
jgi:ankyrin repeat protein